MNEHSGVAPMANILQSFLGSSVELNRVQEEADADNMHNDRSQENHDGADLLVLPEPEVAAVKPRRAFRKSLPAYATTASTGTSAPAPLPIRGKRKQEVLVDYSVHNDNDANDAQGILLQQWPIRRRILASTSSTTGSRSCPSKCPSSVSRTNLVADHDDNGDDNEGYDNIPKSSLATTSSDHDSAILSHPKKKAKVAALLSPNPCNYLCSGDIMNNWDNNFVLSHKILDSVPKGVVNIDTIDTPPTMCNHLYDVNSSRSLTISFLNTYGKDYARSLREFQDGHNYDGIYQALRSKLEEDGTRGFQTEDLRRQALNEMSMVASRFKMYDGTFPHAVSLLDRVLGGDLGIEKYRFMIPTVGMTCLLLASKLNDVQEELTYEEKGFSTWAAVPMKELLEFEWEIVHVLDFSLETVTPVDHLDRFALACGKNHHADVPRNIAGRDCIECLVLYLVELSCISTDLAGRKPDLLAAAAFYLAKATYNLRSSEHSPKNSDSEYWTLTLEWYTGYTAMELEDTVRKMRGMQEHAQAHPKCDWEIYTKYSQIDYCGVSSVQAISEDELGFY